MRALLPVVAALTLCSSASAAAVWAGVNATTAGYGVHAGTALLPVPLLGTLGLEASAERPWQSGAGTASRYAAGLTLRDLNLPLSRVDAFTTVGGELTVPTPAPGGSSESRFALYGEAGLRGPVLGPAGWRAFVRASSAGQLGAGVGLELRF
ncbi:hypothetical protein [Deinococcus multiflagellatus]|uniref:Outer membrane protein beta-barrel domain-containing protein n=1 Tax=Deinococcus multiflagellatus TaxID=1656887 RepID=A0ABW1ZGG9_9DEIO|nr:hypothetical protein [Deinococcus multiflagellatus]MBZ9712928.1 hypothetical protein [Deinococcus multiflagellatus]